MFIDARTTPASALRATLPGVMGRRPAKSVRLKWRCANTVAPLVMPGLVPGIRFDIVPRGVLGTSPGVTWGPGMTWGLDMTRGATSRTICD